jgi:GH25 family lysozyme M1 (1,4-beta-N-acetylmuramidase)
VIFVVDMSNHQGVPDMIKARDQGGVRGAILKLTEGDYYVNELYDAQAEACDKAGVARCLYGYNGNTYVGVDYRKRGSVEAAYLLAQPAYRWKGRPIWHDLEDASGTQPQAEYALEWEETIRAGGGAYAGIYSYPNFIQVHLQDQRLATRNLWLASYPNTPPQPTDAWPPAPAPWTTYRAWQFSGGIVVPGIGWVDGNYFNGTAEEFMSMGQASAPTPDNAIVARSYIDANGVPTTEIKWGGKATEVLGTDYKDIGIRVQNAAGAIYHRSIVDGQGREYVKE